MYVLIRKKIHQLFEVGVILKGIGAFVDIVGSFVVLFVSQDSIIRFVSAVTQEELLTDPNDMFANYFLHVAQTFSHGTKIFAFWYLFIHGTINFILVIGLLWKRLWAYPLAMAIFSLLVVYQLYRFTHTHSMWLIMFSTFDIIVIWLIKREYEAIRSGRK